MQAIIDYRKRIEAIQAALAARGLDALVGTRLKTVTHVAGAFCPWRSATVVPARGEPMVVTLMMDATRVADDSWLGERVVAYGPFPGQGLVDVAAGHLDALGLARGRIGIESGTSSYLPDGYVTHAEYEQLQRALPHATLVNAADVIDRVTLVKQPAEVKLLRQANAICDCAIEAIRHELHVGISEKAIAGIAERAAREAGSEFAWTFTGGMEIASGYRTAYAMGGCTPATDKLVQCHDAVLLDVHAMYGLMLGDVSHNAIMGKPTPAQRDLMGAYVESCQQLVALMQPGKRLGEVAAQMAEFVARKGWSDVVLPGYGHGIGHFGHEWFPCVVASDDPGTTDADVELVPNYVQEIAIVCNRPGVAGFRLERPLLITATGNELLSGLPFVPWVVDEGCVC
ncbi:MAG: Xaa-Pro peptidase family protein [Candidatus Binatia bacterium]